MDAHAPLGPSAKHGLPRNTPGPASDHSFRRFRWRPTENPGHFNGCYRYNGAIQRENRGEFLFGLESTCCVYAACAIAHLLTKQSQIFRFLLSHRTIMARPQNGAALICPPPKWSPFPPHSIRRTRKQARNFHVLATLPCRPNSGGGSASSDAWS